MTHTLPVTLDHALNAISHTLNIGLPFDMIRYSRDDPHGGYHADYDDGFPSGSLWRVEGQALYALVRALRPASVMELGTWHGASATHLLQGIKDNKYGGLICVDSRAYGDIEIGGMIPSDLKSLALIHQTRIEQFLPRALQEGWTYDLIFEDGMHDAEQVEFVWRHAEQLLAPGGVIVSHDACHKTAGPVVREGLARAGYGDKTLNVLIAPADCGFAIYRKGL